MNSKLYTALAAIAAAVSFTSCEKEDVTPSNADVNYFEPSAQDNSATATIRRNFFNETSAYLLFNDTLRYNQTGVDDYGNPIADFETVDVEYPFIGVSAYSRKYVYDYITDPAEQKMLADMLREKLAKPLGKALPYSFLLVNKITTYEWNNGAWELFVPGYYSDEVANPAYLLGTRCYAISTSEGEALTNPDYFTSIIADIVYSKVMKKTDPLLDEFESYVSHLYLGFKSDYVTNDDAARRLGLWQDYNIYYWATEDSDILYFVTAVMSYTLEMVEEDMADYPLVIERFKIMQQIISNLGVELPK